MRFITAFWVVMGVLPGATRPSAPWPPPAGGIRLIIDSDTGTEIDDQYALALALGNLDKLKLEGIIGAHFGESGGAGGIQKSVDEIHRVLELAGMKGKFPVKRGADPFQYRDRPPSSEGVEFIIERAMTATPSEPLWVVLLGPATDAVAALLKEPKIADRMIVFWHGRTQWPVRCWNFNAYNDTKAARYVFDIPSRFILFDTGTYLRMPMEESARRFAGLGPLGKYLHEIRLRRPGYQTPEKGMFDLGDIAALVDPGCVRWERTEAPAVDHDLRYDFSKKNGEILRIHHVERDRAFELLEQSLKRLARLSAATAPTAP